MNQAFIVSITTPTSRLDGTPLAIEEIASAQLMRNETVIASWVAPVPAVMTYWDVPPSALPVTLSPLYYTATVTDASGNVSAAGTFGKPATVLAPVAPTLSVAQDSTRKGPAAVG